MNAIAENRNAASVPQQRLDNADTLGQKLARRGRISQGKIAWQRLRMTPIGNDCGEFAKSALLGLAVFYDCFSSLTCPAVSHL
jgi:hypothetical protein